MVRAKEMRVLCFALLAAGLVLMPSLSGAVDFDKNVHYFQPPSDGSGILLTYGSEPLNWLGIHYGLYADEAIGHLVYRIPDTDEEKIIFKNQTGLNALVAVGITRFLNIGMGIPFVPYREFNQEFEDFYQEYRKEKLGELEDPNPDRFKETSKSTSPEDLRVDVKGIMFNRRTHCVGLALNLGITIPVGLGQNSFLSDRNTTVAPRLIVDVGRHRWSAAFNVAYKIYGKERESDFLDMRVKDEIIFGAGGKFRFLHSNELMLDSVFRTHASDFFGDANEDYGEILGAYRYIFGNYSLVAFTVGFGMGIMEGAGTPSSRYFIGITSYEYHLGF